MTVNAIISLHIEETYTHETEGNNGGIWNCEKHQNKRSTNRTEKKAMVCFSMEGEAKKTITEIKCMKTAMEKYLELCIIKTAVPKFQT